MTNKTTVLQAIGEGHATVHEIAQACYLNKKQTASALQQLLHDHSIHRSGHRKRGSYGGRIYLYATGAGDFMNYGKMASTVCSHDFTEPALHQFVHCMTAETPNWAWKI